jgi:hypothetical protein
MVVVVECALFRPRPKEVALDVASGLSDGNDVEAASESDATPPLYASSESSDEMEPAIPRHDPFLDDDISRDVLACARWEFRNKDLVWLVERLVISSVVLSLKLLYQYTQDFRERTAAPRQCGARQKVVGMPSSFVGLVVDHWRGVPGCGPSSLLLPKKKGTGRLSLHPSNSLSSVPSPYHPWLHDLALGSLVSHFSGSGPWAS